MRAHLKHKIAGRVERPVVVGARLQHAERVAPGDAHLVELAKRARAQVAAQPLVGRQEQKIVIDAEPPPACARERRKLFALGGGEAEGLFDERVTARLEDAARRREMLVGRQQHVYHVEIGREQLLEARARARDAVARGSGRGARA